MRSALRVGFLLLLVCMDCTADELLPFVENGRLGVSLSGVQYPQTLERDLRSGLTNTLVLRLTLSGKNEPERQRVVEIAIRFDLWDEIFGTQLTMDGERIAALQHGSTSEVMALLKHIRLTDLFAMPGPDYSQPLTIRADMMLNPIDGERMEKIQDWVRDNSSYVPPDTRESGPRIGAAPADTLFNRIFREYAAGTNAAAAWTQSISSRPFRLDELRNARP